MITVNCLLGWVYFGAFSSLYIQFPGLYGINGISPISDLLIRILQQVQNDEWSVQNFFQFPSLIRYGGDLNVSTDEFCEFLILVGIISSLLLCMGWHRPIIFFVSWLIYLSFYLMGQTFLSFQWDILLLETGFLLVMNSLFSSYGCRAKHVNWCFRFVVWKLMFMAGVVKLQSQCPTWEMLTALEVHTLCLLHFV